MLPSRTFNFLNFDPRGLPPGYIRFVRATTTVGAVFFCVIAIYGYILTNRILNEHTTDFTAMLQLMKAMFFFVVASLSATMALVLAFISYRCWRPL